MWQNNADNPPAGDTATCTWQIGSDGYIVRIQPHMHLLGVGFTMVLNPGTPQAKTILNVPNYNFDYQKAYNVPPITVSRGDRIQINCTYNPTLAQQLPILRKAPPHFVTFGDGSSDEMCVGVTSADVIGAQRSRFALSDLAHSRRTQSPERYPTRQDRNLQPGPPGYTPASLSLAFSLLIERVDNAHSRTYNRPL